MAECLNNSHFVSLPCFLTFAEGTSREETELCLFVPPICQSRHVHHHQSACGCCPCSPIMPPEPKLSAQSNKTIYIFSSHFRPRPIRSIKPKHFPDKGKVPVLDFLAAALESVEYERALTRGLVSVSPPQLPNDWQYIDYLSTCFIPPTQDMPECRVIPYFKGFLGELKEILSMGGTCTGSMLGDLNDFLRANTSTTTPPTTTASSSSSSTNNNNNNTTTTTGYAPNNNNPTAFLNSTLTLGTCDAAPVLNSTTFNSGHVSQSINNTSSNNISINRNLSGHGEANCMKQHSNSTSNNGGPSKSSQSSTESTGLGGTDTIDSTTRGMQTVTVASAIRSPQDQRRELGGGHPPKSSQQKVVSFMTVLGGFSSTLAGYLLCPFRLTMLRRFGCAKTAQTPPRDPFSEQALRYIRLEVTLFTAPVSPPAYCSYIWY